MGRERKRHPAKGGAVQLGGEQSPNSGNSDNGQPQARRVEMYQNGPIGLRVEIVPPLVHRTWELLPNHELALERAEALAEQHGLPIIDRTPRALR